MSSQGTALTTDEMKKASKGRVERRRDRRRAEIVRAATQFLALRGYHGLNLEGVAEEADIAKATLYHYFSSKDQLVFEALESLTQFVLDRLSTRIAETGGLDAKERLRVLIDEQALILTDTAPEVAAVFSYPQSWPEPMMAALKDKRRRHDAFFRDALTRGLDNGTLHTDSVDTSLQCLHGILNHAAVWVPLLPTERARAEARLEITDNAMKLFA